MEQFLKSILTKRSLEEDKNSLRTYINLKLPSQLGKNQFQFHGEACYSSKTTGDFKARNEVNIYPTMTYRINIFLKV
jgi:hypothetical protein